ncbi:MAG TPA: hypothetical protein VIX37_00890 [Candidatus Sulfotelmatobacter sp.]
MVADQANSFFDRHPRNLDQVVAVLAVGRDHGFMGPDCLVEGLLAFPVWPENVLPWWGDEHAAVIAETINSFLPVLGRWLAQATQISDHIGRATVKENGAGPMPCPVVGAHLPTQPKFSKQRGIAPRQGLTVKAI